MRNFKDFINIKEAAKLLGVSTNTLRNWEQKGKISTYRNPINDYRMYDKNDLSKLLDKFNQKESNDNR